MKSYAKLCKVDDDGDGDDDEGSMRNVGATTPASDLCDKIGPCNHAPVPVGWVRCGCTTINACDVIKTSRRSHAGHDLGTRSGPTNLIRFVTFRDQPEQHTGRIEVRVP